MQSSVLSVRDLWASHQRPVGCVVGVRSQLADRSKRFASVCSGGCRGCSSGCGVPNFGAGDQRKESARDSGFEGGPCAAAFKTLVKRLRRLRRLYFRIGLVHEVGSFRGSDFGFHCIENTTGFSNEVGQLLDIHKTFCLFADC
uniref:Uncharacterized protein n=1 Tax=Romanomermis culicivorax TaxID=13658 RepID=A0A915JG96_ROMCU